MDASIGPSHFIRRIMAWYWWLLVIWGTIDVIVIGMLIYGGKYSPVLDEQSGTLSYELMGKGNSDEHEHRKVSGITIKYPN